MLLKRWAIIHLHFLFNFCFKISNVSRLVLTRFFSVQVVFFVSKLDLSVPLFDVYSLLSLVYNWWFLIEYFWEFWCTCNLTRFFFWSFEKKSWNQNVWFSWPTGGDWSSSFARALVHSLEQSDRFNLIFGDGRTLLRKKKFLSKNSSKRVSWSFQKANRLVLTSAAWCLPVQCSASWLAAVVEA